MTATRIVRPATLAVVAAAVWILAASLLWRTKVPADLHLPSLDARRVFGPHVVNAGARFDRFFELEWLIATLATLAALVVMTRRGPRFVRSLGLGRSEEHTSELQSRRELVCRLLLEKKK